MRRPRVGITIDSAERLARELPTAYVELQRSYIDAVVKAGGVAFLLPPSSAEQAPLYTDNLDALVLSGGHFDIDPRHYRATPHPRLGRLLKERTDFELALLAAAGQRPVLGICGGMQLMNVFRGGTLVQDIASQRPAAQNHEQPNNKREPSHEVALSGSLARLFDGNRLAVNSTHHQAIDKLGRGLQAEAVADDGIIEAIVDPQAGFFVGVQWHPEAMFDERQQRVYAALITAARP